MLFKACLHQGEQRVVGLHPQGVFGEVVGHYVAVIADSKCFPHLRGEAGVVASIKRDGAVLVEAVAGLLQRPAIHLNAIVKKI